MSPLPLDEKTFKMTQRQRSKRDEPLEERLSSQVASLIKRSKARQFYGLMGKRSDDQPQPIKVDRKRNKGDMFVGLMGRRALSGESFTRIIPDAPSTAVDVAEGSDTQPDSQEEWDQLQYY
ncbi:protachykinin-1-like isoform X3 [Salvelinus sp. IW2-2015]|uniref:protachykinin-1-like isoform X3 n=1 Tax=Salvelinus sp. IW2-2015 TaxID=2691554 RepID=UPI000CDF754B|nr:protachykinin-1-like isoform X3 [Salvelinus alpinus]